MSLQNSMRTCKRIPAAPPYFVVYPPLMRMVCPVKWVDGDTVRTIETRGRVTVNNAEAYIACCLAGLGLIQIPAYDVAAHLRAGELVEVLPHHRAATIESQSGSHP